MTHQSLKFISDEDLIAELAGRFTDVIFYGEKMGIGSIGKDKAEGTFHYEGELTKLLGLCERMKEKISEGIGREEAL